MDITGRKILMFRCHIPPMIGPKIQNAYVPKDMGAEAEIAVDSRGPMGVYIKLANGQEHIIPFANVEAMRIEAEEPKADKAPKKTKEL